MRPCGAPPCHPNTILLSHTGSNISKICRKNKIGMLHLLYGVRLAPAWFDIRALVASMSAGHGWTEAEETVGEAEDKWLAAAAA
jgi:hypothetical protein